VATGAGETDVDVDVLVVGAGPGGLQLAHELQAAGVDHQVVDGADAPGSFFRRYPRHRQLISINRHAGHEPDPARRRRVDWNSLLTDDPALQFTRYGTDYFPPADLMVRYLGDFAARRQLRVAPGRRVTAVDHEAGAFTVGFDDGAPLRARRVVLATGVVPHEPAIPGIELAERYADFATDPEGFRDARVLVVGKGNSGFETAGSLIPTAATIHIVSPSPVRLAWATHYVGHLRSVNNELLDTYHLKTGNAVLDAEVTGIRRDGRGYEVDLAYTHAAGQRVTYRYDRIVAAAGFRFDGRPLGSLSPERRRAGRLPDMTPDYRSPSQPGLYFAGTLMQARDHGKTGSGFIHGFRYNVRFLAKVLRAGGAPPPADAAHPADAERLARFVLARIDRSDALFLQPGYLADAYVLRGAGLPLAHHADVPLDWVRAGGLGTGWRLAVTLEYGPRAPDPFAIERSPDPAYAKVTPYLHPVVRLLHGEGSGGSDGAEEVDRLDLLEDVDNRYHPAQYLPHLVPFLRAVLASVPARHPPLSK
jgi:cation diffusion facilitator CzcD-associated flavoprotein CzcO